MSSSINSFIWLEQFIHLARTSPSINLLGSVFAFLSSDFFFTFLSGFRLRFFYAATLCSSCLNHPEGSDLANNTTS